MSSIITSEYTARTFLLSSFMYHSSTAGSTFSRTPPRLVQVERAHFGQTSSLRSAGRTLVHSGSHPPARSPILGVFNNDIRLRHTDDNERRCAMCAALRQEEEPREFPRPSRSRRTAMMSVEAKGSEHQARQRTRGFNKPLGLSRFPPLQVERG